MPEYKYDAFISYRHLKLDQAVAIHLQNRLERLKGPDGKRLRIFRDRTDLPISNNLGDDILEALEQSRFLIVLCSREYQNSQWCMAELRHFRKLHRNSNDRILPVLLEGEPEDVFPEELLWEERTVVGADGDAVTQRVETEPLGADVRGSTLLRCRWKLRTEYLRIAAPILGKSFDDLFQRSRRKRLWATGVGLSAAFLGLAGFTVYNMHMRGQIQEQHQSMLANESLRLAVAAEQELIQGNGNLAMVLAMEALPEDPEDPERPLVAEAETALRSAVYTRMAAQKKDLVQSVATIDFETWGWELAGLYDGGSKLAVRDLERIYLYDPANGMLLFDYPSDFFARAELNRDATRIARISYAGMDGEEELYQAVICAVPSAEVLYEQTFTAAPFAISLIWDMQEDVCYFWQNLYDEGEERLLSAVNADGTVLTAPQVTAEMMFQDPERFWNQNIGFGCDTQPDAYPGKEKWTQLGEKYRQQIEALWGENDEQAFISDDEQILILYNRHDAASRIFSLPGLEMGNETPMTVEGNCVIDTANRRILVSSENKIQILSYLPENGIYLEEWTHWEMPSVSHLSRDGQRCILTEDGCTIRSTQNMTQPLLQLETTHFYVTPQLDYVFIHTPQNLLQLWHVEQGLLMETDAGEGTVRMLAVNDDGSLVATAYDDGRVEVRSGADGSLVLTEQGPVSLDWNNRMKPELLRMEFSGTRLLLTGYNIKDQTDWSRILDTTGQKPDLEIPGGMVSTCYYQTAMNHHLTDDGLLMCTGSYFSGALDAIYDIDSGQCVFRQVAYYQYEQTTGTLLYMPSNPQYGDSPVIHGARRNGEGVFEDVYTVSVEKPDTNLWRSVSCLDSEYFVVMGDDCCAVYAVADGHEVMTIHDSPLLTGYNGRPFYAANGMIFDSRYYLNGALTAYPILPMEQVLEQAREYLTSEQGQRTLSSREKAEFFLD